MRIHQHHLRAAVRHLRRSDPVMRKLIDRVGPCRMKMRQNRFLALTRAIVAQQISSKAAASVYKKVQALVEPEGITAQSIGRLSVKQLRSAGLSRSKARYLLGLAQRVLTGSLRLNHLGRWKEPRVIEHLVAVPGIGEWTAQMFLIFSLGHLDVLPLGDLGVRAAIRNHYGFKSLPGKRTCERIARPWRPYASVASWYCWRSFDIG